MSAVINSLPVLVLSPHARCNCRCVMCDIWKNTTGAELTLDEVARIAEDFERLSVRWVVLTGGEPLMHSALFRLCRILKEHLVRITLLSTGLLLERNAKSIVESVDDMIVSLDGPPNVHDRIRRVDGAFALLQRGVAAIRAAAPKFPISARSTVQRGNYRCMRQTAAAAKQLGLDSVSFLAADLTSTAFNRPEPWSASRQGEIALTPADIEPLEEEIQLLIREWGESGFVRDSREKLERIVLHYRAHLGHCKPVSPMCNAPWVSAVIESDGSVRPCFFHEPIGNIHGQELVQVLNGPRAQEFRSRLDVATNPICRRCVCSLHMPGCELTNVLQ